MPVQIGELSTDIVAPSADGGGDMASGADAAPEWLEVEKARRARRELMKRNARTRAHDFDD